MHSRQNKKNLTGTLPVLLFLVSSFSAIAQTNQLEPGEAFPGGATTHQKKLNKNSFSHPSANMSFENQLNFRIGNGFFKRLWVSSPASTKAADGLGPVYNARSCQRCHLKDGRGHPPENAQDNSVSMFLRLSIPAQNQQQQQLLDSGRVPVIAEPTYGGQLQDFAVQGHNAEGRMVIEYREIPLQLADGEAISLRMPTYSVADLGYGAMHPDTMLSPRIAPQMIGLGLLEAIKEEDLLANADPQDNNSDGISGKPNRIWSPLHQQVMLGRYGWKAGNAGVDEQSQGAFSGDMGLSTPLHPNGFGECTTHQKTCTDALNGNSPQYENLEVHQQISDLVLFYSRNLAVPARRNPTNANVLAGKKLFNQTGCAACHTPSYTTGQRDDLPEQSNQKIWPYTDLMLHDMGPGLADNRPEGLASGQEWKTPPLWGIGLTPIVNNHSYYLHDGRARSLLEAVLWHGGEAQPARDKVVAMSKVERQQLIQFIESL
ncbi:di-heme oxidoreductase family protein [Pelagibaculum spongiae]|uniref:Thiol oxidoreductase n=1 Tax=Pelagibaculum spongiae TaxID=2080658 RepID=A0A2V1H176_9GAMM|nr:di-heme oxidoredictase family protein [Pelagibaculum spongiae]PVZ72243.1 thiol oxidoreductase [Pelagibaculum spongiae]